MNNRDLAEEIDHFLSFGWGKQQVADALDCHVSTVEKRLARARLADLAARETAIVYSRQTTEWSN